MAQAKVTDYYTRRKRNSTFQPTKRSARNAKLSNDSATAPATKAKKLAQFAETLPVTTAAFGPGSLSSSSEVNLASQLQSFQKSKSEANSEAVSDLLTRTFTGGRPKRNTKTQISETKTLLSPSVSGVLKEQTESCESRRATLEKTPLKRLASDSEKDGPPRRKRSKPNVESQKEMVQEESARTPTKSKKVNAVKVRRRLETNKSAPSNQTSSGSSKTSDLPGRSHVDIDPAKMREKLAGCGKLEDLQARLALVKGTAAEIKKLREQTVQVVNSPERKEEEKHSEPQPIPAFERYRHLIQAGPSPLALPFRYRSLEEAFRCSDTVVGMLHNRSETCTFSKLKYGVQEMSRKTFDLSHLKQIKTVYPSAYDMHWAKTLSRHKKESEKRDPYTLILEPNLAGIPTDPSQDQGKDGVANPLITGLIHGNNNKTKPGMFDKFTPSMLIARRTLFHNGLVDIVKSHHQDYLAQLTPPIPPIPEDKLFRWHPKFPLEKIPDVALAEMPEPPRVKNFNSARDVLDKAREMMVNPKVTAALELVAKNTELKAAVEAKRAEDIKKKTTTESSQQPTKSNQALKGVSQDLLNRIKAKEARNSQISMMRSPEEETRIGMLERLPELCRILRVLFLAEKKAALPIDLIIQKLIESYRSALSRDEMEKHINLMIEVLPDWLKKVHIRKDCYVKMDRTKELSTVINIINTQLSQAKKVK